uniref:Uncharacterized protein n=1 Tax=Triticum urartu TaxID=4572 RepID=A0A8R7TPD8_TRIUA
MGGHPRAPPAAAPPAGEGRPRRHRHQQPRHGHGHGHGGGGGGARAAAVGERRRAEVHQLRRAAGGRRALLPAGGALLQLPRQHHRQPLLPRLRVHHPLPRRRPFLVAMLKQGMTPEANCE